MNKFPISDRLYSGAFLVKPVIYICSMNYQVSM